MLSALILAVFLGIIGHTIGLIEYSSKIVGESLTVYENPIFYLKISGSDDDDDDDDRKVFLIINKDIASNDRLRLNVEAERFDGVRFLIPKDPVLLCDLLEEEATNETSVLSNLRFSRAFNMEGMQCPIASGERRLMPYMFPPLITLYNDIGCGQFDYKIIMEKCEEDNSRNCLAMISVNTIIDMQTEHCSNNLV